MHQSNRRQFLKQSGQIVIAGYGLVVAESNDAFSRTQNQQAYYDLIVKTDNGLVGSQTNQKLILKAEALRDKLAVTTGLEIDEGNHQHQITLTVAEIASLNAGQIVSKKSAIGTNGDAAHGVTINPNDRFGTRVIYDNGGTASNGTLAAILGFGPKPHLYVEALVPISQNGLSFCFTPTGQCSPDTYPLILISDIPGRQIFRSKPAIALAGPIQLMVTATLLNGQQSQLVLDIKANGAG